MTDTDAATAWLDSAPEIRELRRILYAAIDPETGAASAQDVRDLIQGELNAIATTPKEVVEREFVKGSQNACRSAAPPAIRKDAGRSRSATSFGADDWVTVADGLAHAGLASDFRSDCRQCRGAEAAERLRAADRAKTEALRFYADEDSWRYCPTDRGAEHAATEDRGERARAALAAAAAAPKETP